MTLVCAVMLLMLAGGSTGAWAAGAIVVQSPTITGSAHVNELPAEGYAGGALDWVLTEGIDGPETSAAVWSTPLERGDWQVEAWDPAGAGTTYARYIMSSGTQSSEVRVRQSNFANEWVTLATVALPGPTASIRSSNNAGYKGEQLAFSAIRFTPVASLPPTIVESEGGTIVLAPEISGPEGFVTRFAGVGFGGYLERAFTRGAEATPVNSASWKAPVPSGTYQLAIFIPREHAEALANYVVHTVGGAVDVPVLQKSFNDFWVPLGQFELTGSEAEVSSSDATGVAEQELAWSSLRLTPVPPASPPDSPVAAPETPTTPRPTTPRTRTGSQSPTVAKKCARSKERSGKCAATTTHAPAKNPVDFKRYTLRHGGPENAYGIVAVHHTRGQQVSYRCSPCLMMSNPFQFIGNSETPVTRRVSLGGNAKALIGKFLYKGSYFTVTVTGPGRHAVRYSYRLPGAGRILRGTACAASSAPALKACRS